MKGIRDATTAINNRINAPTAHINHWMLGCVLNVPFVNNIAIVNNTIAATKIPPLMGILPRINTSCVSGSH